MFYSTQNRTPRWRKKVIMFCPFWVSLSTIPTVVPLSLVPSVRRPFTGLLTNYLSFAPLSYKIGLIRTLIDRVFKINNTWLGFHKDIVNLAFILRKNLFPVHLIDKCVYRFLNTGIDRNGSIQNTTSQGKQYFYKLPYLGHFLL